MFVYSLPFLSALIGWFTNYLAIKMLFHPKEPKRILFFKIQGIFPKRQGAIAERLGKVVAEELISFKDLKEVLLKEENIDEIHKVIDEKIEHFLRNKLKEALPMMAMFIGDNTINQIKEVLVKEFEVILPEVIESYVDKLESDFDIEKIVYDKVVAFSSDKFEDILFAILKKEFRFIELIGAVVGFVIGAIEILLIKLV